MTPSGLTTWQEGALSFLGSGFVGGTQGDGLEIPRRLLHVWGQEDMKVLLQIDVYESHTQVRFPVTVASHLLTTAQ